MNALLKLNDAGQSYWLDDLSREMLDSGELAQRVREQGLRGVTSNPTIFDKAIAAGSAYEDQLGQAAREGADAREIYELLTTTDVRRACDVLRPVFDATNGADGFVSLEVSPHLAHDTKGSIEEARRLASKVDRPNVMIKIPGTREGIGAIEQLLFEGINVNITLLFSVGRYEEVAEAYLRALERRLSAGQRLDSVASVASFFLSRIDVLVDELLAHRLRPDGSSAFDPNPRSLMGRSAIANAKFAYRLFQRIVSGERWKVLEANGARPQRLLWASTSTKNPSYRDVMYVEPLIGPCTINTMPEATIAAFADHGVVEDTLTKGIDEAIRVMHGLRDLGIDFKQVTDQLENEGIQKFIDAYDALLRTIEVKRSRYADLPDLAPLATMARKLRRDVIRMTTAAGSGHPTSCMSAAEIVSALFFSEMRWDPRDPHARDVDLFVLSKGHAAPLLWAALYEAGAIHEDLLRLRRIDSTLEGHPTPLNPWVRVATGSLGQGLSAANGMALANRLDGIEARVYCLLGDGECAEGSVWEAAQFAALNHLSSVIAIVDENGLGQSGPTPYDHDSSVFAERFRAFGWKAIEIDGHDLTQVLSALHAAHAEGPTAIIARTVKGKGVSFLEGKDGWHGKALDEREMQRALAELGPADIQIAVPPRHVPSIMPASSPPTNEPQPRYELGNKVATREAFGSALAYLGESTPDLVVLDGDVKNSTHTEAFAKAYPQRFFESYIAEQNMVGTALGLAACGKIPVVATFACFLSRAYDFIRMAGHSSPRHLIFCGSHAGISVGEDGPSQMGLEDLAMFRAVHGSSVFYPCDAVSADRLTVLAVQTPGIVYLRTTRPKTAVIYGENEVFRVGGSKVLRRSDTDEATIVAAGITVYEALEAADALARKGVRARVIDAYSVKPLDVETLLRAAHETRHLVVVEDHWMEGGLGEAVAAAVASQAEIRHLAIAREPRSGTKDELLERYGISSRSIEQAVLQMVAEQLAEEGLS
ncbi:MAG TPA: transketolase [Burkholderiales bacterium]|nr:transketolase [Burkholderiales bacterium]